MTSDDTMISDDESLIDDLWPPLAPPDGFADRVLDAVKPRRRPRSLRPLLLVSAIAAALALAAPLWISGAPRPRLAESAVALDLGLLKD